MFNLINKIFTNRTTGQWIGHDEFHLDKSLNQSNIKLLKNNNWKQINENIFKYQSNDVVINPINLCYQLKLRPTNKMKHHHINLKCHPLNLSIHSL